MLKKIIYLTTFSYALIVYACRHSTTEAQYATWSDSSGICPLRPNNTWIKANNPERKMLLKQLSTEMVRAEWTERDSTQVLPLSEIALFSHNGQDWYPLPASCKKPYQRPFTVEKSNLKNQD